MNKTAKEQKHSDKSKATHKDPTAANLEKREASQNEATEHKPSVLDPVGTQAATEPFLTEDGLVTPD
jgi:hypothetical protein